jgi:hypothetical protein
MIRMQRDTARTVPGGANSAAFLLITPANSPATLARSVMLPSRLIIP